MTASRVGDERLLERFWNKVAPDEATGCWLWTACLNAYGYGRFNLDGENCHAHRVAYSALVGPIPEGFHVDHLCRVRNCVNPAHLQAVTASENCRRARLRPVCGRGHEMAGDNLGYQRNNKRPGLHRYCRACRALWW